MKPMIRILSLSALVLVAVLAALYFALPSNQFRVSFPEAPEPGIGTPSPRTAADPDAPAPPLLVAAPGSDRITISWQTVADASTYEIWGRQGEVPWAQVDDGALTGSSTSFAHTPLNVGDTYYYTGRTVAASGKKSSWAAQVSATVFDTSTVPAVTLTPAIGQIRISWNSITGADSYHLITWTDGQDDWERIGDPLIAAATAYTHTGLIAATTYHYRLRAVTGSTEGDWSASVNAVPAVPAAPTLTVTAAIGQVELSWNSITGADSYQIITWNDDLEDWERIGDPLSGATTAYTHSELTPGQSYYYSVRAVVDGAEGDWSDRITAIPSSLAAPTLAATAATGQIELSWNAVTGAESYHLIVWTDAQNDWVRIGDPLTASTTSFTHSPLTADQTYYYGVSAVLGGVSGAWSNTISAMPATASLPGLIATAAAGQIQLNWNAVTGAESYHIIMWTDGQTDWERIGDPLSGSTTSYTHSGLTAGATYFLRIRVVVNSTESEWSEQIDVVQ